MRRLAILITACLGLAVFTGCRSSSAVAVTIFGDINEPVTAVTTADKDYDGVDVLRNAKADLALPLP